MWTGGGGVHLSIFPYSFTSFMVMGRGAIVQIRGRFGFSPRDPHCPPFRPVGLSVFFCVLIFFNMAWRFSRQLILTRRMSSGYIVRYMRHIVSDPTSRIIFIRIIWVISIPVFLVTSHIPSIPLRNNALLYSGSAYYMH